jgi:hypothetical protein
MIGPQNPIKLSGVKVSQLEEKNPNRCHPESPLGVRDLHLPGVVFAFAFSAISNLKFEISDAFAFSRRGAGLLRPPE